MKQRKQCGYVILRMNICSNMQRSVWLIQNSHESWWIDGTISDEVTMINCIVNAWSRMSVDSESESPWISVQALGCCLWESRRHEVIELHTSVTAMVFNVMISFQWLTDQESDPVLSCLLPKGSESLLNGGPASSTNLWLCQHWIMLILHDIDIDDTLQQTVEGSRAH